MNTSGFGRIGVSAIATIALLTACALRQDQSGVSPTVANGASPAMLRTVEPHAHGVSWVKPDAVNQDLLYVSNRDGIVNMYGYQSRHLVGQLLDFTSPAGQCTDASGNVYITDYGTDEIAEYPHGGKRPLRIIDGSPYEPYGCAVNPKNGDLAVANYGQYSYDSKGNLAVYAHAQGTPTYYTDSNMDHVNACAYDKYGDLLVTGFVVFAYEYIQHISRTCRLRAGRYKTSVCRRRKAAIGPIRFRVWGGTAGIGRSTRATFINTPSTLSRSSLAQCN
jgi:hypothetical protein